MTRSVAESLRGSGRSRVHRLAVSGGRAASVILKAAADGEPAQQSAQERFCNEWAGCRMLGPLGLGPRAYAGDADGLFCLMEDLGAGETLADALQGYDPASAASALLAYPRSLGAMHAATKGEWQRWASLRRECGGWILSAGARWSDVDADDQTWGLSSTRQRVLAVLENTLARDDLGAVLPAFAQVADALQSLLRSRWADTTPMPPYPAFAASHAAGPTPLT